MKRSVKKSENKTDISLSALKKRYKLCVLLSAMLFMAAFGGFYLGWKQVKTPALLVAGFTRVTSEPQYPHDITPQKLKELTGKFKTHDFAFISPDELLKDMSYGQLSDRKVLFTFENPSLQLFETLEELHKQYPIKGIILIDIHTVDPSSPEFMAMKQFFEKTDHFRLGLISADQYSGISSYSAELYQTINKGGAAVFKVQSADYDWQLERPFIGLKDSFDSVSIDSNTKALPRIRYLSDTAQAGQTGLNNWLPPASASKGALTITLALMLIMISANWLIKASLCRKLIKIHSPTGLPRADNDEKEQGSL